MVDKEKGYTEPTHYKVPNMIFVESISVQIGWGR